MSLAQGGLISSGGFLGLWRLRDDTLVAFGAIDSRAVIEGGQYWRLLTAMLLHASIIHLLFNGFAIYQLGGVIEIWFGGWALLFLHLVLGLVANLVTVFYHAEKGRFLQVGASGAIFGLITFVAMVALHQRRREGINLMVQMFFWAGVGLAMGAYFGADNAAHVGGAIAGVVVGNFELLLRPGFLSRWVQLAAGTGSAAVFLAAIGLQAPQADKYVKALRAQTIARRENVTRQADFMIRIALESPSGAAHPAGQGPPFVAKELKRLEGEVSDPALRSLLADVSRAWGEGRAPMTPETRQALAARYLAWRQSLLSPPGGPPHGARRILAPPSR